MAICSQGAGPRSAGSSLTSIVRGPRAAAPFRAVLAFLTAVPPLAPFLAAPCLSASLSSGPGVAGPA